MLLAPLQFREVHQQGDLRSDSSQRQKVGGVVLVDPWNCADGSRCGRQSQSQGGQILPHGFLLKNSVIKARNESCCKVDRRRGRFDAEPSVAHS